MSSWFSSVLWCPLLFLGKKKIDLSFPLYSHHFVGSGDIFILFVFIYSYYFHIIRCSWNRWVALVEQELASLPDHLSSSPVFSGFLLLVFSIIFCGTIAFSNYFHFLLTVVVLVLQFTFSDHSFDNLKLFHMLKVPKLVSLIVCLRW